MKSYILCIKMVNLHKGLYKRAAKTFVQNKQIKFYEGYYNMIMSHFHIGWSEIF